MSQTIESLFVRQYSDTYTVLCEQKDSRLLSTINNIGTVTGSTFTANEADSLGDTLATPTRFGTTSYVDQTFASRLAIMSDFSNFTRLSLQDLPKLKANPQDEMLQRLVSKRNRKIDNIIYTALLGNTQRKVVGADTYTNVALPTTQVVGTSTTPLTKQALINIRTSFYANEVPEDEVVYILYDATMLNTILGDATLQSSDYTAIQGLQTGQIKDFLGMRWVHYEGIKQSDGKSVIGAAYTSNALQFGSANISPLKIVELEAQNRTQSIGHIDSYGATRVDEKRVVKFQFAI